MRAERATAVEGSDMRPVLQFSHTGLPAAMLHATSAFSAPSPIQAQCWPIVLSGLDLIGIAATGSGKTLAFGLPMLRHIVAQRVSGVCVGGAWVRACMGVGVGLGVDGWVGGCLRKAEACTCSESGELWGWVGEGEVVSACELGNGMVGGTTGIRSGKVQSD